MFLNFCNENQIEFKEFLVEFLWEKFFSRKLHGYEILTNCQNMTRSVSTDKPEISHLHIACLQHIKDLQTNSCFSFRFETASSSLKAFQNFIKNFSKNNTFSQFKKLKLKFTILHS